MQETPRGPDFRPIREVTGDWVGWVRGRLTGDANLISPLSQRPCAYYKLVVERQHPQPEPLERIAYQARGESFVIEDESGRALVDPDLALVEVDYDRQVHVDGRGRLPQSVVELLRRLDVVGENVIVREGVLAIGEIVAVHGRMVPEADDDASQGVGRGEGRPRRLRVRAPGQDRVVISERSIEHW
ncbi:MAG TPA: hypothetical protein VHE35_19110 [Kofleriaceae bacterium]|nr:hypothetical protein [Kofleriaceae bacterium]